VTWTGDAGGGRLTRWVVWIASAICFVLCFASALATLLVAATLVGAWYNRVAEDAVVLVAVLFVPMPWIAAAVLWRWGRRLRLAGRLALTASGVALSAGLAIAIMIVAAVLGDTTGTARL